VITKEQLQTACAAAEEASERGPQQGVLTPAQAKWLLELEHGIIVDEAHHVISQRRDKETVRAELMAAQRTMDITGDSWDRTGCMWAQERHEIAVEKHHELLLEFREICKGGHK
jgi:hypothetical protein